MPPNNKQWVEAAFWLGGFAGISIFLRFIWLWMVQRRFKDKPAALVVARAAQGLIVAALLFVGLTRAALSLDYVQNTPRVANLISQGLSIAWIWLFAVVAVRAINAGFELQELGAEQRERIELQDMRTRHSLYRKLLTTVIMGLVLVYALRTLGVDVTPLLAGGTIGGIVLGLALQESLSNFFSGIFLNMDRPAKVGDLVRLENGQEGFVEEIGWRSTKVRLWSDAMLVLPNNKFASSWLINFHQPAQSVWVSVDASIEYGSDLDLAERVAVASAKQAMESVGHKSDNDPYVRWREFGDSGIILRVFLPATDPETQYRMRSEFIKALKSNYETEGIDFAYPTRKLILPLGSEQTPLLSSALQEPSESTLS